MRKLVILFLVMMLFRIPCFSSTTSNDSTVLITSEQLKTVNLIFAEHEKLSLENCLLKDQIDNYEAKINLYEKSDSLKEAKINYYQKTIKKQKKITTIWQIGSVAVIILLLL